MKCKNNCLAQINIRECPGETGCLIFSDNEQIEFADGDIGCRLTRTQIKKKLNKRARVLKSTEKNKAFQKDEIDLLLEALLEKEEKRRR